MPQRRTILLAERDRVATQLLRFILESSGLAVITTQGGRNLIEFARTCNVDLILTETALPDHDGMQLCRQLRADWRTRDIPIVLLASYADQESRIRGLLAGADDYISKPADLTELILRLNHWIDVYAGQAQRCPITRLPGHQMTRDYVTALCSRPAAPPWALFCLNLRNFRVYNQIYSHAAGDDLLKMVAGLLRQGLHRPTDGLLFAGHPGADHFTAVVPLSAATTTCETLIAEFDRRILEFYPEGHHTDRYDMVIDRRGVLHRVPWVTLAIGVITADLCDQENIDYLALEDIGTAVVKGSNVEAQSSYHVNQRRIVGRPAAP